MKNFGFYYFVNKKTLKEYKNWNIERKLEWLYLGNLLRKSLPPETIKIQEMFRKKMGGPGIEPGTSCL